MGDVKLVAAVCPKCGANLRLPEDFKRAHCTYCGTEVIVAKALTKEKVQCPMCKGNGKLIVCSSCNGRGTCNWSISAPVQVGLSTTMAVAHCSNGTCSACGGSGTVFITPCAACGGSGVCPQCHGSGKCMTCQGLSMLPSPGGTIVCKTCGGDGVVDPDDIQDNVVDKCPACDEPWTQYGLYCRKCGQPKDCPRCGLPWKGKARFCSNCGWRVGMRK